MTPEHHAEAILRQLDRAIERIMGVEIEAMDGDNLAVVLCSHFDDNDGSEPNDCGWSQTAVNAYEEIKQEIAGKFVPVREDILSAVREAMEAKWLPIETAPRDGSWFMAYWPVQTFEDRVQTTQWLQGDWRFVDASDFMDDRQPTHWLPLPTPPRGE
jgi:hypothetical protein